jgi:hypothetical protein
MANASRMMLHLNNSLPGVVPVQLVPIDHLMNLIISGWPKAKIGTKSEDF